MEAYSGCSGADLVRQNGRKEVSWILHGAEDCVLWIEMRGWFVTYCACCGMGLGGRSCVRYRRLFDGMDMN